MKKTGYDDLTIVISGFYGNGNIGDESILAAMLTSIRAEYPRAKIIVFSNDPRETETMHGVCSYKCWVLGSTLVSTLVRKIGGSFLEPLIWWFAGVLGPKIIKVMWQSDIFILGGGGLLSDEVSRTLPRWLGKVCLARLLRKKIMIFAVGAVRLSTPTGRFLARTVINMADCITVRDRFSKNVLSEAGVEAGKITVTADPAVRLAAIPPDARDDLPATRGDLVAICLASFYFSAERWKDYQQRYPEYKQTWLRIISGLLQDPKITVILVPMQYGTDITFIREMLQEGGLEQESRLQVLEGGYKPGQLLEIVGRVDIVIAMRLHAMILSALAGTPFIAISYSPKTRSFVDLIHYENYSLDIENLRAERILNLFNNVSRDRARINTALNGKMNLLRDREKVNIRVLKALVERE